MAGFMDWVARNKAAIGVLIAVLGSVSGAAAFLVPYVVQWHQKGTIAETTVNETRLSAASLLKQNCRLIGEIQHHREVLNPRAQVSNLADMRDKVTEIGKDIDAFVKERRDALKDVATAVADEARARTEQLKQNKDLVIGATASALGTFTKPPLKEKAFADGMKTASFYAVSALQPTALLAADSRRVPCDPGPFLAKVEPAMKEFAAIIEARSTTIIHERISPMPATQPSQVIFTKDFLKQLEKIGDLNATAVGVQLKYEDLKDMTRVPDING